jgi:hypothetical protein
LTNLIFVIAGLPPLAWWATKLLTRVRRGAMTSAWRAELDGLQYQRGCGERSCPRCYSPTRMNENRGPGSDEGAGFIMLAFVLLVAAVVALWIWLMVTS